MLRPQAKMLVDRLRGASPSSRLNRITDFLVFHFDATTLDIIQEVASFDAD